MHLSETEPISSPESTNSLESTNTESTNLESTKAAPTSKEQILDAAQAILAVQGYAGLSMRELAAESGLAKATIYHHFQDKRDLFRSVLERDMTMVHDQIVNAANEATGAVAKIHAVIRTYVALMQERRTVIMSVLRELGQDETNLCEFIQHRRSYYFAPIAAILEAGIAEGVFRPLNTEHAAISLVGMINAFVVFHTLSERDGAKSAEADQAIIEHTANLFLHGITTTEPQR